MPSYFPSGRAAKTVPSTNKQESVLVFKTEFLKQVQTLFFRNFKNFKYFNDSLYLKKNPVFLNMIILFEFFLKKKKLGKMYMWFVKTNLMYTKNI